MLKLMMLMLNVSSNLILTVFLNFSCSIELLALFSNQLHTVMLTVAHLT